MENLRIMNNIIKPLAYCLCPNLATSFNNTIKSIFFYENKN